MFIIFIFIFTIIISIYVYIIYIYIYIYVYYNLFRHSISTLQRKFASGSLGSGGAWLQGHPGHLFEVGQGVAAGQIRGPPWVLYASWFHEAHRGHPQSRLTGAKRREWMGCWGLLGVAGGC